MSNTPNSFTTDRALTAAGLLGGGAALGGGAGSQSGEGGWQNMSGGAAMGLGAAILAPRLLYSQGGQNALRGMFGRRPSSIKTKGRELIEQMKLPASIAGGMQAPEILNNYGF